MCIRDRDLGFDRRQLWGLMGSAFLKHKRPEKAVEYFAKAQEADPQNRLFRTGYLNSLMVLALKLFHAQDFNQTKQIMDLSLIHI